MAAELRVDLPSITASDVPSGVSATKIADGSVTNAEFQRLDATSSIQGQLDGKAGISGTTPTAGQIGQWVDGTTLKGVNGVELAGDNILIAGVSYPVKKSFANLAASQTNQVLQAAVTSKKLRVIAFELMAGATATNVTFTTVTGTGAISPLYACPANGGIVSPLNPFGYFDTISGEALGYTTGAGSSVAVRYSYIEV